MELNSVCCEDKLHLICRGARALSQRPKRFRDSAFRAGRKVNVIPLKDAAGHVRGIVVPFAKALERDLLIAKCTQEGEGELDRIEGQLGKLRYRFFDFDGVHDQSDCGGTR